MLSAALHSITYVSVLLSLFLIDYILGNGLMATLQKIFCKSMCFIKKAIREEAKKTLLISTENPLNLSVLFTEIIALLLTIAFLNKYKQLRTHDKMDRLLQESKEALRQSNEFLDKWRIRRVPAEYSYLEESQEIELPVLDMAIIDTLGTIRSQPERGDAGDTVNITDSTLLSVASYIDDDIDSLPEPSVEDRMEDGRLPGDRLLWDVMEEDDNVKE